MTWTKEKANEYYKNYRKTNLTQLTASIDKDAARELKYKLKKDKLTFAGWLKDKINKYLGR